MHALLAAAIATVTATNSQLSLQAIAEPELVTPNSKVTITFALTPARRMHLYAPGAKGYQALAVKLDTQPGVKAHPVVYPPSEMYYFEPLDESVPVYSKPITVKQVVEVSAAALKGKQMLTLSGALEYQACDDRVCYKPNAIPFTFELKITTTSAEPRVRGRRSSSRSPASGRTRARDATSSAAANGGSSRSRERTVHHAAPAAS
jgi:hypothetical protein